MLCQIFGLLQEIINVAVIGQLDNSVMISAVGLGNIIVNIFGYATFMGLNSALCTFVAQSFGAGEKEVCGVYLWRGRYLLCIVFAIILPIFMCSEAMFEVLGQDKEASQYAQQYIVAVIPGLFLLGMLDLDRNFLTSFGKADITLYCQFIAPVIHYGFAELFAIHLDYKIVGLGIAGFCTNLTIFTIQNTVLNRLEITKEATTVRFTDPRAR